MKKRLVLIEAADGSQYSSASNWSALPNFRDYVPSIVKKAMELYGQDIKFVYFWDNDTDEKEIIYAKGAGVFKV